MLLNNFVFSYLMVDLVIYGRVMVEAGIVYLYLFVGSLRIVYIFVVDIIVNLISFGFVGMIL